MITTSALFALVAWLPLVVLLFGLVPQRRAIAAAYVLGWLFLPQAVIPIPGALPDYGRSSAIAGGVFAAILLLDFKRFETLRPHWLDLPMLLLCFTSLFSSLSNGLGVYDGLGQSLKNCIQWGTPYLIARLYFGDAAGLKLLALAIVTGGLVYVPLCLYEARMSPSLHADVYGFAQHQFGQTRRLGGWRPMVFLNHGLEVGFFMASASLLAFWLWLSGTVRRYEGLSMLAVGLLVGTTVLCRSTGAILLLAAGVVALLCGSKLERRLPIVILALLPITYATVRTTGTWKGEGVVDVAQKVHAERARSLQYRLDSEEILIERARLRLGLGWGGWGRNRIHNDAGQALVVTDGYWIITLGMMGVVGLAGMLLAYLLPVVMFVRYVPTSLWASPVLAPATGMVCLLALGMIDNLMNAMFTPFAPLMMGALTTFFVRLQRLRGRAVSDLAAAAEAGAATGSRSADPRPGSVATDAAAP